MDQKQHEEALYEAMKRRDADQDLGPVGRWVFLSCVILFGIAALVFVLWVGGQ